MARPSLKEQRSKEILDAFERCVARYGVEGATLEKIAEEAGLQRSLLRHNVGNREDLLDALVNKYLSESTKALEVLESTITEETSPKGFVKYLFDESYSDPQAVLVAQALIIAAQSYTGISPRLQLWVEDFTMSIVNILKILVPKAKTSECRIVATGIVGIYFNVESLTPLGAMKSFRRDSMKSALRLIESLHSN